MIASGIHGGERGVDPQLTGPPPLGASPAGALPRAVAAIVASADAGTVIQALLEAIRAATGADRVLLVDPHVGTAAAAQPADDVVPPMAQLPDLSIASIERAATTRKIVCGVHAERGGAADVTGGSERPASAREILCVPVTAFGTAQAVLYLDTRVADGSALADAAGDLEAAASQLALCVLQQRTAASAERTRRRAEHEEDLRRTEAVATLAGGIAHDFNNHLTVINGLCDLLLDGGRLEPVVRTDLNEIRTAGESAAVLTNQLLSYSGRQIMQPAPADLHRVLRHAEGKLRRTLGPAIDLALELSPDPAWAQLDEPQIEQVLLNLAANARAAIRGAGVVRIGTGRVEVAEALRDAQPALGPGAYVFASVSDTGPGIPPDVLPRIFDPFFTTAAPGQQIGLGLPTAYGILRQLGGGIAVDAGEGRGATFTLYFRRAAAPKPDDADGEAAANGERILIVEDRDDVRRLAVQMLSRHGYAILAAPDGPTAIQLAADSDVHIDLLVTDVVMPGMNGRELARALTAARPGLRVLYTSGYAADQIGDCGVLEDGLAYLRKPFSPRQLRARVREVLDEPVPVVSRTPDRH
jgi:signal transduction histidine kinase/ActR/RegA family two-component response regulator